MADAKFELRGWENTDLKVDDKTNIIEVLGLLWDRKRDLLFCNVTEIARPPDPITRRKILSTAQKIFDPIGFLCPVTLYPKLLLQESWKTKLSWDAEVPEDIKLKFLKWLSALSKLKDIKIPRCIQLHEESVVLSLHTFCDASQHSYAAVVYLRSEVGEKTYIQLVQAKARVAPLKKVTIPRLELLACCIGVRLALGVAKSLNIPNVSQYFWTDSSTALTWIKKDAKWGAFVENRVKEIRSTTNVKDWRHISGALNSADLPSRGCSVQTLLTSN